MAAPIPKTQQREKQKLIPQKTEMEYVSWIGNNVMQSFKSSCRFYVIKTSGAGPVKIRGTFSDILNEIKKEKKAAMFLDFVYQLSEEYRVRQNDTNMITNMLGMEYDQYASDPTQVFTIKKLNCLSGNLSFACFVYRLAEEANINIRVTINEVVSTSGSDYAGHVIGRVEVNGDGSRFFDITNTYKESLEFIKSENEPDVYYAGGYRYVLGASYIVTDTILSTAQIQQKIMTGETFSDNDLNSISEMDPTFLSYLMDDIIKFASDNAIEQIAARVKKISDANAKLRLSLHLVEYYDKKSKIIKAVEYTKMAARAIINIIEQKRINQIKITPYLTKFARAFRIATDHKFQNPELFYILFVNGFVGKNKGEIGGILKDNKIERTDFFDAFYNTFNLIRRMRDKDKIDAKIKENAKLLLEENLAIIQFRYMVEREIGIKDLGPDEKTKYEEIKKKLAEHLEKNCLALGLDLEKIAEVSESFLFSKNVNREKMEDPGEKQLLEWAIMVIRFNGLIYALNEKEPENIEVILKGSYLSKLDYYLRDPDNAAIKKALGS